MGTFQLEEATIRSIMEAFESGELTSRSLTLHYMERIAQYDKSGMMLNSVLELNPDALYIAEMRDVERKKGKLLGPLHGIPIMVKDNIDTADKMHTSAGSLALADSFAPKDAFLVRRLRDAGAVILGKTNMTEFANYMTRNMPNGYSSRGGQVLHPYGPGVMDPSGSSTGSAVAVSANLCVAAIGTETSGSILSPASSNGIVGIKPTLGLISRAGIIPITYTQDTAGPMARTVEDAAILLGVMAGVDQEDPATWMSEDRALQDYTAYLDKNGLKGARIGVNLGYKEDFTEDEHRLIDMAVKAMRQAGAEIVENTNLPHIAEDSKVMQYEFKSAMNRYLASLGPHSPINTLRDIIEFNHRHEREALKYGQSLLLEAEHESSGTLTEPRYIKDRTKDWRLSREEGLERLLAEHRLDALFCPGVTDLAAVSGYPSVIVPAGLREDGKPFGVAYTASAYSEPTLLKLAYAFEQLVQGRTPPKLVTP